MSIIKSTLSIMKNPGTQQTIRQSTAQLPAHQYRLPSVCPENLTNQWMRYQAVRLAERTPRARAYIAFPHGGLGTLYASKL